MASRSEQKQRARRERELREQARTTQESRRRRLWLLGALVVTALVVVGVAVALGSGSSSKTPKAGQAPAGARDVATLFAGIPQNGTTLGKAGAPVTLVEYADLKCPICRQYSTTALPTLVQKYVRTGKLRVVFRPQTFVGESTAPGDSERAARMALAAGAQNRLWNFAELFYDNQGDESSSYVTDDLLQRLGRSVPGLDVSRALAERSAPTVSQQLSTAASDFQNAGFSGTPSFQLGKTGGSLKPLTVSSFDVSQFSGPIDRLLASS